MLSRAQTKTDFICELSKQTTYTRNVSSFSVRELRPAMEVRGAPARAQLRVRVQSRHREGSGPSHSHCLASGLLSL